MLCKVKYYNGQDLDNRLLNLLEIVSDKELNRIFSWIKHIYSRNWNPEPPIAKPLSNVDWELNYETLSF